MFLKLSAFVAAFGLCAASASAQVLLNEVFVSHTGTDTSEFVEVKGPAGTSLAGYMILVVEGDGAGQGTLDRAYDLSAGTIGASGFYVLGCSTIVPAPDQNLPFAFDNLENGCETVYLITTTNVAAVVALVATNVSASATTTTLPANPNIVILDKVGLVDSGYPATDAIFDGAPVIGPDGTFFPAGAVRCSDAPNPFSTTVFCDFNLTGTPLYAAITPGTTNNTCGGTPTSPGIAFCFGDGTGTACPCANNSTVGNNEGCLSSLGTGGKLVATGTPSISADTMVLTGTLMPNSSALYFQGAIQAGVVPGDGTAFGDGKRCAGGSTIRLGTKTNVLGTSSYPVGADPTISVRGLVTAAGTRTYQGWYRNAAAFCTASTFNLTNGWEITWTL